MADNVNTSTVATTTTDTGRMKNLWETQYLPKMQNKWKNTNVKTNVGPGKAIATQDYTQPAYIPPEKRSILNTQNMIASILEQSKKYVPQTSYMSQDSLAALAKTSPLLAAIAQMYINAGMFKR